MMTTAGNINMDISNISSKQETSLLNDITQKLARDINILSDPLSDRNSKRNALNKIKQETLQTSFALLQQSPETVEALLKNTLIKTLLKCWSDQVEKCRELSIEVIFSLFALVPDASLFIPYVIQTIVTRLASQQIVEPSEEIRLLLVSKCVSLVNLTKEKISPFVEDLTKVILKSLGDPFPDIKKETCNLVISLSKYSPLAFSYSGDKIPKELISVLIHRHSSVRLIGIKALQAYIQIELAGLDPLLDTLWQLIIDKSPAVRQATYTCVSYWQMNLCDRFSVAYKLLPFLIAGCSDPVQSCIDFANGEMIKVGEMYELEWVDRVKNEIDALPLSGHPLDRPRIGAKHICKENTMKIVEKLVSGMSDWTVEIRSKSILILNSFIWYTQDYITGYVGSIIPVLCRICSGDEVEIINQTCSLASTIGNYVSPSVYMDVILPLVKNGGGGSSAYRIGSLKVLKALINGASPEKIENLENFLQVIQDKELIGNENIMVLDGVCKCVGEICNKIVNGFQADDEVSYQLFLVLVQLVSFKGDDNVSGWTELNESAKTSLNILTKSQNLNDVSELYKLYAPRIFASFKQNMHTWTVHSFEVARGFENIVVGLGEFLGMPQFIFEFLDICLGLGDSIKSVESRLCLLPVLQRLLSNPTKTLNSHQQLPKISFKLLESVLIPNAIWKAGKKHTALRNIAIECIYHIFHSSTTDEGFVGYVPINGLSSLGNVGGEMRSYVSACILPMMMNVLDDDALKTRLFSIGIVDALLEVDILNAENFKLIYPELLKRLDDSQDTARISVCKTLKKFSKACSRYSKRMEGVEAEDGEYIEKKLDNVHWESMIKTLTIHMDDLNEDVQVAVCECLKSMIANASTLMEAHLKSVRVKHRSPRYIDELLTAISNK